MWQDLRLSGGNDWLALAVEEGTCVAVCDGSYMRERFPGVSAAAFVLECSRGTGRMIGSFSERALKACAYRGELLGLLAVHLLLLAVAKLRPRLRGGCRIYCDCVGALRKVAFLPRSHLPSGCRHSDVLKIVMLHCSDFSFAMEYVHVRAHQDTRGRTPYKALLRPAQLNCQVDRAPRAA